MHHLIGSWGILQYQFSNIMHWWIKTNFTDYLYNPSNLTKTCARNTGQNEIPKHKFPISDGVEHEMYGGRGKVNIDSVRIGVKLVPSPLFFVTWRLVTCFEEVFYKIKIAFLCTVMISNFMMQLPLCSIVCF